MEITKYNFINYHYTKFIMELLLEKQTRDGLESILVDIRKASVFGGELQFKTYEKLLNLLPDDAQPIYHQKMQDTLRLKYANFGY